jgi:hypothetical protein
MKATTKVQLRTAVGMVEAPCYHQWKQKIAGTEFDFALHVAAGHAKGFVAPLAISELGTGYDVKATITHPVTRVPLSSANIQGLKPDLVKRVAQAALHNLINKRVGPYGFLQAMVGAQIQLAKSSPTQFELIGSGTETFRNTEALDKLRGLGTPGVATFSAEATPAQVVILDQMFGACKVCNGSKVVSTTDKDHEGNYIEITCPACIPKAIELVETKVGDMAVGFHPDPAVAVMDVDEQYIPSAEEAAAAMADAETMNQNMAKYGTIDEPAAKLGIDWTLTEADLPLLRHQREQLQLLADQHGTMTGDTTEQDYEALAGEIADLDDKIADLEGKPCSK